MAGTTLKRSSHVLGMTESSTRDLVIQHNAMVDDMETARAVLAESNTLIEELHDDAATNKTIIDELKTDYTALLADVTAIRAVLADVISGSGTWDPGSLIDGAGETSASITAPGAALGDFVLVSAPYDLQGITCNGYVDATSSVKIRLQNETAGTIDLASGTWRVRVIPQASFAAPSALTATSIAASSAATLTAGKPTSANVNLAADLLSAKIGNEAGTAITA